MSNEIIAGIPPPYEGGGQVGVGKDNPPPAPPLIREGSSRFAAIYGAPMKFRSAILIIFCFTAGIVQSQSLQEEYRGMTAFRVAESFTIKDLTLTRDAGTFEFLSGKIDLVEPVQGHYHTAVFSGDAVFRFHAPTPIERDQVYKFTGSRIFEEKFHSAVFKFSDSTADDFLQAKQNPDSARKNTVSNESKEARSRMLKRYSMNVDSRILRDLYSETSGYFLAYINGATKGEFLFEIDPEERESVALAARGTMDIVDVWSEFEPQQSKPWIDPATVPHFEMDIDIDKDGKLESEATLDLLPRETLRTIKLNISPLVEVKTITDDQGKPCFFIYETAEDRIGEPALKQNALDVFFPEPFQEGVARKLKFAYRSEDLIERIRSRNEYFIKDTTGWYPSYGYLQHSTSRVTYHYPADLQLLAVGEKIQESKDGKKAASVWEQKIPVAFICFSLGDFNHKTISMPGLPPADIFSGKHHTGIRIGGDPLQNVGADVINSIHYFQSLFGRYPFPAILVTEIPARHGQGFPGFLHLSGGTFEDTSLAGVDEAFRAHEVSHQWWGHLVGWETYHDQWLSEGFAEYSGALYASAASKDKDLMLKMAESWKSDILNKGSVRTQRYGAPKLPGKLTMGTEAGPIWLGQRLMSSKSPADYQILVYSKGAYVLHMLRMMMRDFQTNSDDRFFEMLADFVNTYSWKNANTEGFQKVAEKHYGKRLQWFFDQWVYGTRVPKYEFHWSVEPAEGDRFTLICNVEQKNVPDGFQMPVPIYLDFGKDRFAIERILVDEPSKTIRIPLPEKPQNVTFNYYRSVLAYD